MKLLNLLFCLLLSLYAQAQNFTISGRIESKSTGEVVPFASIGLKNTLKATVSNTQGSFEFHLSEINLTDTLVITSIGYNSLSLPVKEVVESGTTHFLMSESEKLLDAIVIRDSLSGQEIVNLAVSKIPENYPDFPISMNAFYRESQAADGSYVSLVEAAITIYDENNLKKRNAPLRTKIRIDQLRRSLGYPHPYNSFWEQDNLLMHLFQINPVPYRLKSLNKLRVIEKQNLSEDGKLVYKITLVNSDRTWPTTLFIQAKSYVILRIEEYYDSTIDDIKTWPLRMDSTDLTVVSKYRKMAIDFREYNNKYYLNRLSLDANHDYTLRDSLLTNFRINQEIIVNDIKINDPDLVERNEALRLGNTLKKEEFVYNEEFWNSYNVIKETPLEEQLVKDLEKRSESLSKQFMSNQRTNKKSN